MAESKFSEDENPASVENAQQEEDFEIEIEDDTPEEDKGKEPMPKELVKELEDDELEDYSDKVKTRLKQMKKVYHDERRAKETADRERQEAVNFAQKIFEENKRLKNSLNAGQQTLVSTATSAAEMELSQVRKQYKEAYDSGDSDQILDAQEKLSEVTSKLNELKKYRPALQETQNDVNMESQQAPVARPEPKALSWQERNAWFGKDTEMTSAALGLHQKLVDSGMNPQSDEYYQRIDSTMRRRFPEHFGEEETTDGGGKPVQRTGTKSANVVAPASRSTSSKKIVLKQSQLAIAKKLGLTPQQYAIAQQKLENQNG
jgi:hypothetical protein